MVSTTDFIVAIELGSSKIAGIVGKKSSDGSIQVLAYAKEESSSFIKKGAIFNLDKTAQGLTSIIKQLEGSIGSSIAKVYIGISGQSLHGEKHFVERDLKTETVISQELIDEICDENRSEPSDEIMILEAVPQEYKVGNILQVDPVGVPADFIEGRFLNIVARSTLRKNMERCFEMANIRIAEMFISPLVTAQAVLTESEKRSGCALVDFGADTTTVSIYKNNILRFLTVIPLGGNSITRDIASLHLEEYEAEQLKIEYGSAYSQESIPENTSTIQSDESQTVIDLSTLNDIIEARAEEIVQNMWFQIEISGYAEILLSGIIITGGGSNLRNMDELIRRKGQVNKIRIAKAPRFDIHSDVLLNDGTQNTLFGLIAAGKENCRAPKPVEPQAPPKQIFDEDEDLNKQKEAIIAAKREKEEEARKRKEEEKKRREEEKRNKPSWFKKTFDDLSEKIFSDEDMK